MHAELHTLPPSQNASLQPSILKPSVFRNIGVKAYSANSWHTDCPDIVGQIAPPGAAASGSSEPLLAHGPRY